MAVGAVRLAVLGRHRRAGVDLPGAPTTLSRIASAVVLLAGALIGIVATLV
jgi:hypothetical protein